MAASAGRDAQSEAQMYLSQGQDPGTRVADGGEASSEGTGEAGEAERREEIAALAIVDARKIDRAVGEARDKETSQRGSKSGQEDRKEGATQAGALRAGEKREFEEMGLQGQGEREGGRSGGKQEVVTGEMGHEDARVPAGREEGAQVVQEPGGDEEQESAGTAQVQYTQEHVAGTRSAADEQAGEQDRTAFDLAGDYRHEHQMGAVRGLVAVADDRDEEARAEAHQRYQVDAVRRVAERHPDRGDRRLEMVAFP